MEDRILEISLKLLELLGVSATVDIKKTEEDVYLVRIQTDEPGLLIGYHGETLESLQLLVAQLLFQKFKGYKYRIVIDIAGWREKRQEKLSSLAHSYTARARETGEPQHLFDLSPTERRYIHILLADSKDVYTESVGEGRSRHLVIYPKH